MHIRKVEPVYKSALNNKYLIYRAMRGIKIPCTLEREDIEQTGWIGLLKALRTYDPEKGASFAHYAILVIKRTIMRMIRKNLSLSPIPLNWDLSEHSDEISHIKKCGDEYYIDNLPSNKDELLDTERKLDLYALSKFVKAHKKKFSIRQRAALMAFIKISAENKYGCTPLQLSKVIKCKRCNAALLIKRCINIVKDINNTL